MNNEVNIILMDIISNVGAAKGNYIEAIRLLRDQKESEASKKIEVASDYYLKGHKAHAKLITLEANNEDLNISLLLIHAEDQLLSCETFKIFAEEIYSK